jgi:predicted DCC family thiol-disulfide oxidoreductase YuxK
MAALRRLHATDSNGRLHIGVDAFILIWQQLPRWRLLAILVGIPGLRHIATMFYNGFADYRFARLEHCKISVNEEKVKPPLVK